jgi:hypothetical protein
MIKYISDNYIQKLKTLKYGVKVNSKLLLVNLLSVGRGQLMVKEFVSGLGEFRVRDARFGVQEVENVIVSRQWLDRLKKCTCLIKSNSGFMLHTCSLSPLLIFLQ